MLVKYTAVGCFLSGFFRFCSFTNSTSGLLFIIHRENLEIWFLYVLRHHVYVSSVSAIAFLGRRTNLRLKILFVRKVAFLFHGSLFSEVYGAQCSHCRMDFTTANHTIMFTSTTCYSLLRFLIEVYLKSPLNHIMVSTLFVVTLLLTLLFCTLYL